MIGQPAGGGGSPPLLLSVVEVLAHARLRSLYESVGYAVHSEFAVRKAIAWLRGHRPQVVVADFYHQPDFRDRLSNLESLLAALQRGPGCRVLVLYDAAHRGSLDKVGQRFRIDAALTTPVREEDLRSCLAAWLDTCGVGRSDPG